MAEATGVPGQAASKLIAGLEKAGVARATDLGADATGYVLARPAERVLVSDVLAAARRARAGGSRADRRRWTGVWRRPWGG